MRKSGPWDPEERQALEHEAKRLLKRDPHSPSDGTVQGTMTDIYLRRHGEWVAMFHRR